MKNILLICGILIISFSCGNRDKTKKTVKTDTKKAILVDNFERYEDNAKTEITSVSLEKNILTIGISYSGGCEEHDFSLIGVKMITKSLPPQRGITLFHNNNNDNCRELVDEEINFDISDFRYKEKEEIILILDGWNQRISYTSN